MFDTETTGLDVFNDDIIQIAAMKMRNGTIVPGSELDIIIKMDGTKKIPPTLHNGFINPMVEEYKKEVLANKTKINTLWSRKMLLSFHQLCW